MNTNHLLACILGSLFILSALYPAGPVSSSQKTFLALAVPSGCPGEEDECQAGEEEEDGECMTPEEIEEYQRRKREEARQRAREEKKDYKDYVNENLDKGNAEDGKGVYENNSCAECHGDNGEGGVGPNLFDARESGGLTLEEIMNQIIFPNDNDGEQSVMPTGLTDGMTKEQFRDLIKLLDDWGVSKQQ